MRGVRAGVSAVLAAAAALALAGCEPFGPAYPDGTADIDIQVSPDGTAVTEIYFDNHERTEDALLDAAHAAAHIFTDPGAIPDLSINGNSGGYPFAVVTTEHVFVPGPNPVIAFDTSEVVEYLLGLGLTSVDVTWRQLDVPYSPGWQPPGETDGSDYVKWEGVTDVADSPRGTATLHPDPNVLRAYVSVLGALAGLIMMAIGIACLAARRHRAAGALGAAATVSGVLALAANGYGEVGELVASGGPSWPYTLFEPLSMVDLLIVVPGAIVVMMLGFTKVPHPYVVFNPPPGWAQPETGWLPYAGWSPPPTWPPAPKGWEFLTPVRNRDPRANASRWARLAARGWVSRYESTQGETASGR